MVTSHKSVPRPVPIHKYQSYLVQMYRCLMLVHSVHRWNDSVRFPLPASFLGNGTAIWGCSCQSSYVGRDGDPTVPETQPGGLEPFLNPHRAISIRVASRRAPRSYAQPQDECYASPPTAEPLVVSYPGFCWQHSTAAQSPDSKLKIKTAVTFRCNPLRLVAPQYKPTRPIAKKRKQHTSPPIRTL